MVAYGARWVCLWGIVGANAGCSTQGSQVPVPEGSSGGVSARGGATAHCQGKGFDIEEAPVLVDRVTAKIIDADGNPVADESAQICGLDLCIFAATDQLGNFRATPHASFLKPAFKYGTGIRHAQFAFRLRGAAEYALGSLTTVMFPEPERGAKLLAGTRVSSGPATLELAQDARIEIDRLTYLEEREQTFRAVSVPLMQAAPFEPTLEFVVAMTPMDTRLCPPAKLSVPNQGAWPAGTQAEFLLHGVSIKEEWAPYGGWAVVSEGAVSQDGNTVETNTGEGIPILGTIGIRRSLASN